ncbi:MAG: DUF5654 family protein [Candidatus Altimarinota bacterium]
MAHKNHTAHEVKKKLIGYITGAFALVGALAWNDAIKALIETLYDADRNTIMAKFIYAIVISILVILIGVYLSQMTVEKEDT